ncbi:hypothetical protein AAG570_005072 [Ranatra chinensis]|uniref:Uncharacterized protein n=1 Tax=Ranatra chinensis TaxID=642074 RepID=A0ABD0YMZ8_9HEMI
MASKGRNMFQKNKTQETTENVIVSGGVEVEVTTDEFRTENDGTSLSCTVTQAEDGVQEPKHVLTEQDAGSNGNCLTFVYQRVNAGPTLGVIVSGGDFNRKGLGSEFSRNPAELRKFLKIRDLKKKNLKKPKCLLGHAGVQDDRPVKAERRELTVGPGPGQPADRPGRAEVGEPPGAQSSQRPSTLPTKSNFQGPKGQSVFLKKYPPFEDSKLTHREAEY